jgi:hypothetical protein
MPKTEIVKTTLKVQKVNISKEILVYLFYRNDGRTLGY